MDVVDASEWEDLDWSRENLRLTFICEMNIYLQLSLTRDSMYA